MAISSIIDDPQAEKEGEEEDEDEEHADGGDDDDHYNQRTHQSLVVKSESSAKSKVGKQIGIFKVPIGFQIISQ